MERYKHTVDDMVAWLRAQLLDISGGTTPFIGLDLNDGVGVVEGALLPQSDPSDRTVGPFTPQTQRYAGTRLRKLCLELGLAFINTYADAGNTYYPAGKGVSKKLDYIIAPIDLLRDSFEHCKVLDVDGHYLQLRNSVAPWDHWPLLARFAFDHWQQVQRSRAPPTPRWDHDAMRACVLHGQERQPFLDSLATSLEAREQALEERFDNDGVPDAMFADFLEAVTEAGHKHFLTQPAPESPKATCAELIEPSREDIRELSRRLMASPQATLSELADMSFKQLLNKHQRLKRLQQSIGLDPSMEEEAHEVHWAIQRVCKRMKDNKKRDLDRRREATVADINQCWARRRTKEAWKLSMSLCATAPRRKYRRFDFATVQEVGAAAWKAQSEQSGPEGGFNATCIDYGTEVDKILGMQHSLTDPDYTTTPTADHLLLAEALVARLGIFANKLRLGKATVDFSVPNEIYRMVMRPRWVAKADFKFGVGHVGKLIVPPVIRRTLVRMYAKVLSTRLAPH